MTPDKVKATIELYRKRLKAAGFAPPETARFANREQAGGQTLSQQVSQVYWVLGAAAQAQPKDAAPYLHFAHGVLWVMGLVSIADEPEDVYSHPILYGKNQPP